MRIRTWHVELLFVTGIMCGVAGLSGKGLVEWVGAAAVVLGFAHAQVSDRLAENQATKSVAEVTCWRWSARYFLGKEVLWSAYFAMHHSWAALVGVGLFLAYPLWRKAYRVGKWILYGSGHWLQRRLSSKKVPYVSRRAFGDFPAGTKCLVWRESPTDLFMQHPDGQIVHLPSNCYVPGHEEPAADLLFNFAHKITTAMVAMEITKSQYLGDASVDTACLRNAITQD